MALCRLLCHSPLGRWDTAPTLELWFVTTLQEWGVRVCGPGAERAARDAARARAEELREEAEELRVEGGGERGLVRVAEGLRMAREERPA